MNQSEKYFVTLISSYLNQSTPPLPNEVDWQKIYRLACIHNVCAIVADRIMALSEDTGIDSELMSQFRQQLGYTLIDSGEKEEAQIFIKELLESSNIDYIFIKGAVLKNYYPVPELRTSSDTDVIIRHTDMEKVRSIIAKKATDISDNNSNVITALYNNQHIEIHSERDSDHPYFDGIFDMCEKDGNKYIISDELHLIYVLCHMIKHFKMCGAGIKMFMDIDVLLRRLGSFDYKSFIDKCSQLNIDVFASACFSLCRKWFDTPICKDADLSADKKVIALFEEEILNSGNFGFNVRDLGNYYINKGTKLNQKNSFITKIRAMAALFFPKKEYLMRQYKYARKCPFLLPIAWANRIAAAVFKRSEHSKNTIKSIFTSGKDSQQYINLLRELDIRD